MILKYIIFLLSTLIVFQVNGQNLSIGDSLPSSTIHKIINSVKKTENTADYNNKLLIIDFWSTGCPGCVEALPRMEALQKHFGDKIKIMPVTSENESYTINFLKNNKYTKKLNISSVVEDQLFNNYFKFKYLPHEVWVYRGKVLAITDQQYVDAQNIKKILDGDVVTWPLKYDFYNYDSAKPLFALDERQVDINSTAVSYAAISDYREKYSSALLNGLSSIVRFSIKKSIRTYILNESIFSAYVLNWMKLIKLKDQVKPSFRIQPNQVVWEVTDRFRYIYSDKSGYLQDWLRKNAICFESVYPDSGQNDRIIVNSIISDLDRLLGLHVRWEKRKEKVFIIIKDKSNIKKKIIPSHGNYLISNLVYNLNEVASNPYFFDESRDRATRIPLDSNLWKNFSMIQKTLKVYGFDLKEEERVVDKLIFTEVDGGRLIDAQMQMSAKMRRETQKNIKEITPMENRLFLDDNKKQKGVKFTSSGLQYKVLREGTGLKPNLASKVQVHYEGRLINGKIFDSSYESGIPVIFTLDQVISGWTEALQMMQEGSKWQLYVPAELAYGSHTNYGQVPPNSTLIFEIELLKILP